MDKGATQRTHNYGKASWSVGYDYRVRAVNSAGEGANSNVIMVGGRPTFKSGTAGELSATAATDRVAVTLDWSTILFRQRRPRTSVNGATGTSCRSGSALDDGLQHRPRHDQRDRRGPDSEILAPPTTST